MKQSMNIIVLSRQDSKRRIFINKKFFYYGIYFEYFDAIPHEEVNFLLKNKKHIFNSKVLENRIFYTDSKLSCALSHKMIIKSMKKEDVQNGLLVFEDDVMVPNNILSILDRLYKFNTVNCIVLLSLFSHSKEKIVLRKTSENDFFLIEDARNCASTMAYFLSKDAVAEMIEEEIKINDCADVWNSHENILYCYKPGEFLAAPFQSEIEYRKNTLFSVFKFFLKKFLPFYAFFYYRNQKNKILNQFVIYE